MSVVFKPSREVSPKHPHAVSTPAHSLYAITPWQEYEQRKADWQIENQGCTPSEYEAAIKRIAGECGV